MDIVTTYPAWFSIFCVLLGGGYAFLLYRYDPRTKDLPLWIKRALAFLRFLLVLILAFLLLKPLLRTERTEVEDPIIAVLQDASASIPVGGDSAYYHGPYFEELNAALGPLQKSHDLRRFSFGKELEDSLPSSGYPAKQTDLARAIEGMQERFRDRNLGGVILATDGIYNTGADPRYFAERSEAPFYMIALGDTTVKQDLIIKDLVHNRYAYQGNRFPLEIAVRGRKVEGKSSELTIRQGDQELYKKTLDFERKEALQVERTTLQADSVGLQRYTVSLDPLDEEVSTKNNVKEFFIEVLESKRKVLALAHAPHPDIRALRTAIEKKNSYKVRAELAEDFQGDLDGKDLLILHQLPSEKHDVTPLIEKAKERDIPILFVLGSASSYDLLNPFLPGLDILSQGDRTDEARALRNESFGSFDVGELDQRVSDWPPLTVPFGEWKVGKGLKPLFKKKVGQVSTDEPLWAFAEKGQQKTGIIAGEGLWRWRLRDMADHGNTRGFDKLVEKSVQYLSVREDKSRFRVEGQKEYRENEAIVFTAELYDKSYELTNDAEVRMEIRNEEGKSYPFSFSRTSQGYRLDAGSLPIGEYNYEAKASMEGDSLVDQGRFTVTPVDIERSRTVADHGLLYDMARESGGMVFYPDEMEAISDSIEASGKAKPVRYRQESMTDLIAWKWLFLALLLLMSIEWVVRKRMGAY